MKNIYLIVGESGSGKTTIVEQLEQKYGLKSIQSYTTRPKRFDSETGHIFVSDEKFDELTDLVAYTIFDSNRYCATSEQVENNDLYIIDPKGIEFFMKSYKGSKNHKIIYINSDIKTRYKRMVERDGCIRPAISRMTNDTKEFYKYRHHLATPDYTIENNEGTNLDFVVENIYNYICSCEKEVM